jgi:hypothetical protein
MGKKGKDVYKKIKKDNYCCLRFKESVDEGKFVYVGNKGLLRRDVVVWHFDQKYEGKVYADNKDIDETEWFMPEWLHIYYCPFCGTYIKGKGFGRPPKSKRRKKQKRR